MQPSLMVVTGSQRPAIVSHAFEAREANQLTIDKQDTVYVLGDVTTEGWIFASKTRQGSDLIGGECGWIPASYIKIQPAKRVRLGEFPASPTHFKDKSLPALPNPLPKRQAKRAEPASTGHMHLGGPARSEPRRSLLAPMPPGHAVLNPPPEDDEDPPTPYSGTTVTTIRISELHSPDSPLDSPIDSRIDSPGDSPGESPRWSDTYRDRSSDPKLMIEQSRIKLSLIDDNITDLIFDAKAERDQRTNDSASNFPVEEDLSQGVSSWLENKRHVHAALLRCTSMQEVTNIYKKYQILKEEHERLKDHAGDVITEVQLINDYIEELDDEITAQQNKSNSIRDVHNATGVVLQECDQQIRTLDVTIAKVEEQLENLKELRIQWKDKRINAEFRYQKFDEQMEANDGDVQQKIHEKNELEERRRQIQAALDIYDEHTNEWERLSLAYMAAVKSHEQTWRIWGIDEFKIWLEQAEDGKYTPYFRCIEKLKPSLLSDMGIITKINDAELQRVGIGDVDVRAGLMNLVSELRNELSTVRTEDDSCFICMENARAYACVPCGHLAFCEGCTQGYPQKDGCPLCSARIQEIRQIY